MKRLAVVIPLLLIVACPRPTDQDETWAIEAVDSAEVARSEAAILVAGFDRIDPTSPDLAASGAAAAAATIYQPSTCVTASAAGPVVTYQLDDCTGPFGLVDVTGTVVVTYSLVATGIEAHAAATDLLVNGASMDIDATATYTVEGTEQFLDVTTTGQGTGPRGASFVRNGDYTFSWDSAAGCAHLDGQWSTQVLGRTWSTQVSGYHKCQDRCPDTGTISYTGGISGVTVMVTFDGSPTAGWSSNRGNEGTIALFCTSG